MIRNLVKHKKRILRVHKSTNPDIDTPSVLVTDTWDYVDLYLKYKKKELARFYWKQARSFYKASLALPKEASPLTSYYCFLNATKALLESKGLVYEPHHGVSGKSLGGKTTLENESINIKGKGVVPALIKYLGYNIGRDFPNNFSLLDCFYNLPYLHRSFLLTYKSTKYPELYIPILNPYIVKHKNGKKAWFCAELDPNYSDKHTINKLAKRFEKDNSYSENLIIRDKKGVRWAREQREYKVLFSKYNKEIRKYLFYIHGSPVSWYLKRDTNNKHSPLVLAIVAMHRLSELSRYTPEKLVKHFDNKQNWLLSEFIKVSLLQFIDEISSEITGLEFKIPKNAI